MAAVERELAAKASASAATERAAARSIVAAARRDEELNLAFLSIPGEHVAYEAAAALEAGLHVFCFSDGVSLEDEVALKRRATERGLLFMGADCGTAIIDGVALGFANAVRRGPVGIVGASGTGIQEVSCLLDAAGVGVSHAIGVGGRDLSAEVGGLMTRAGLEAAGGRRRHARHRRHLQAARPGRGGRDRGGRVGDRQAGDPRPPRRAARGPGEIARIERVSTLTDAALLAAEMAGGTRSRSRQAPSAGRARPRARPLLRRHALHGGGGDRGRRRVHRLRRRRVHPGRAHPMIDPSLRIEALAEHGASDR